MGSRGQRSNGGRGGVAYNRLQQNGAATKGEFVTVPNDLKGYVIGKDGCTIKEIMKSSGAKITSPRRQDDGFLVKGDAGQREYAKRLILEKVHELQIKKSEIAQTFELVEIPSECKGLVIGKRGENLRQISSQTGADLIRKDGNVYLASGTEEQRQHAKQCIREIVRRKSEENAPPGELVDIPREFKGLVMGSGGYNLNFISTKTGAKLIRKDREVYIVSGTDKQKEQARLHIKAAIAGAIIRGLENEFVKPCVYIDDWNLPEDCEVKLKSLAKKDRTVHPGWDTQYRLIPSDHDGPQVSSNSSTVDPPYLSQLMVDALESLQNIKQQMKTKEYPKADMWCHFGTANIRGPDEEEAEEGEWTIKEVVERFQSDNERSPWRTSLKGGVDLDEKTWKGISSRESTTNGNMDYVARYDLTFLMPLGNEIRFKIWITRSNTRKKLEDIPIPFNDVKNILDEIHFEDEFTRSRCRGWLVLPSRKYLQADILFPGCEFDCRLTIRGRMDSALIADYVPDRESRQALSEYLCRLSLKDENGFEICLPEGGTPEGFHLIHNRRSERSRYEICPGFTVTFSKESSWPSDLSMEEPRELTDLHLHCREWDELLNSGEWEPEQITAKLPQFFRFVKDVQRFVLREMRTKTDQ
ncbi:unnamed protein product [Porites evermanni]|uniref:K Homology domain-containing protein n=1 Tax=Porites evermanni TaxID=104178 RepID=A0ABN8PX43_9CNID|nr:unnamed protein product [Porites evermanni]